MANRFRILFLFLTSKHHSIPQIYITMCDFLCVFIFTKFHVCFCFSDLPTTSATVLVSTTTASRTATASTMTPAGSANTTTEVIPKAVSEATVTTSSFHPTPSILIDSEMTTGNSNLSQHCKKMRFLFSFSIYTVSQKLMYHQRPYLAAER